MTPFYAEDGITLWHGRADDILPTLPEGMIDLCFTSPPYNLGNSTGGGATYTGKGKRFRLGYVETPEAVRNGNRMGKTPREGGYGTPTPAQRMGSVGGAFTGKRPRASRNYGLDTHDDDMPHDEYRDWQQAILRECWRVIRPDGAIFYNHKPRILYGVERWPTEFVPEELPIRQTVIWHRGGGVNVRPLWYVSAYEVILIIAGPDFRLVDHGMSAIGDVWSIPRESDNHGHPAPFPVALPARSIQTAGAASVIDPFAGTGSTLVAAKRAGIEATGIELNESYCEIAVKRLRQTVMRFESPSRQEVMAL